MNVTAAGRAALLLDEIADLIAPVQGATGIEDEGLLDTVRRLTSGTNGNECHELGECCNCCPGPWRSEAD